MGEAVITTAGNMRAGYVIHTVGPIYGSNGGRDAELLAACYENSIALASQNQLFSIAFPAISTGAYGYPKSEAARVARWDFDLSAARQKMANSGAASGIKLELPWPATPPDANRLHLFVRYETADGRKLQTDREIFLTPPGQISNRWTPRTVQRQRAAAVVAQAGAVAGVGDRESGVGSREVGEESKALDAAPPASLSGDETAPRAARPTWSPHR